MRYRVRIEVSLKLGHSDPEGETTAKSLRELRYPVDTVNVSKVYEVYLRTGSLKEAEKQTDEMCRRLLANPTKDNYRFNVEEAK